MDCSLAQARITAYDAHVEVLPCPVHPWQELFGGDIRADISMEFDAAGREEPAEFALYRLLVVESAQTDQGGPLAFQQSVIADPHNPRRQANRVRVTPPPGGFGKSLRLRYRGPVCGYAEASAYVRDHISSEYTLLRLDCLWYPILLGDLGRIPADFTYQLTAVVPRPLVAVCAGRMHSVADEPDGRRRYVWQMTQPTWRMTVAAAAFEEHQVPGVPVTLYTAAAGAESVGAVVTAIRHTTEWAERWLGGLPSESACIRVVEIPERWGSEAGPGLILLTRDSFAAGSDREEALRDCLVRVGHELLHLWGVPSREKRVSRWLDEGITHYLEAMLLGDVFGADALATRMEQFRERFVSGGPDAAATPLAEAGSSEARDDIARGKGPWVLHVLRHLLGDDQFRAVISGFLAAYRRTGADLDDFAAYAGKRASTDLGGFFLDWFWGSRSSALLLEGLSVETIASGYAR